MVEFEIHKSIYIYHVINYEHYNNIFIIKEIYRV
jgi:hypothetical protein